MSIKKMRSFDEVFDKFAESQLSKMKFKNEAFELELERESSFAESRAEDVPIASVVTTKKVDETVVSNWEAVLSPIVGIVYLSPSPEEDNFVEVGTKVQKGETICILEAMKVFNDIPAPIDGVVKKIHRRNEDLVGVGDVLFEIEPC